MNAPPAGAGHDEALEWRRDRPAPQGSEGDTSEFVQFYLDDFDCPEMIPSDGWEDLEGTMGPTHCKQRKSYQRWGGLVSLRIKLILGNQRSFVWGLRLMAYRAQLGYHCQKNLMLLSLPFGVWALRSPPQRFYSWSLVAWSGALSSGGLS